MNYGSTEGVTTSVCTSHLIEVPLKPGIGRVWRTLRFGRNVAAAIASTGFDFSFGRPRMHLDTVLPTFRLERGMAIAQTNPSNSSSVTLDSSALDVLTDLTQEKAATTHPATTLRQAEQMMIYLGVRMLFVVNDMPSIEGLITATDLRGDKQMRVVHERGLRYDEVCVADVMTDLGMLDAIDYSRVKTAAVGNAIATLKRFGRNHLLVVEGATEKTPRRVRGVISRSQIERQLGTAIDITPIASSFAEIERALG